MFRGLDKAKKCARVKKKLEMIFILVEEFEIEFGFRGPTSSCGGGRGASGRGSAGKLSCGGPLHRCLKAGEIWIERSSEEV